MPLDQTANEHYAALLGARLAPQSWVSSSHALIKAMSLHRELNPGPSVYKTDALPPSHTLWSNAG